MPPRGYLHAIIFHGDFLSSRRKDRAWIWIIGKSIAMSNEKPPAPQKKKLDPLAFMGQCGTRPGKTDDVKETKK